MGNPAAPTTQHAFPPHAVSTAAPGPLPADVLAAWPADSLQQWLLFCRAVSGLPPADNTADPRMHVRLLGERADVPRSKKDTVAARRIAGPASVLWPALQAANARGWAVYVAVNTPTLPGEPAGVVKGGVSWTKDRFTTARNVVAELDTKLFAVAVEKDPALAAEQHAARARFGHATLPRLPEPTAIVLSRGGPHLWWNLAPHPAAPNGLPAVAGETLSHCIATLLGADEAVWDRAHVLRAPGFFHWKQPDGFYVRLVGGTGQQVDAARLAGALPDPQRPVVEDPGEKPRAEEWHISDEERAWALRECARVLVELGPSVEGKNGDNHLYRKVIPTLQDHGLTWQDARPLLLGWSATCQPPWAEEVLRAKWLRAFAAREDGPRAVELRRIQAMVEEVVAAKEAKAETLPSTPPPLDGSSTTQGGTPEQPALNPTHTVPTNSAARGTLPEVHYRPGRDLLTTVRECLAALQEPLQLWDLDGVLARTQGGRLRFGIGKREIIRAHLQAHVQLFVHGDSGKKRAPLSAYKDVAKCIAEIEDVRGALPAIKGVCTHPAVLRDGEVIAPEVRRGDAQQWLTRYDRGTGTVFLLSPSDAPVYAALQQPGGEALRPLQAAQVAKDALLGLVEDFPFASPADRSAWLAALLTVFARRCIDGPAPLFLFEGNQAGAGKTLLADVLLTIQGDGWASVHWHGDAYQDGATLLGLAQQGATTVYLDNVSGAFGDGLLDKLLTGGMQHLRLLGTGTMAAVDTGSMVWLATGNNIVPRKDLARRTLRCALVNTLPPDTVRKFKHPDLLAHVRENRAFYQSCVLTLLHAYVRDGAQPPPGGVVPFRSFDAWTRWVRGALSWLGETDVFAGEDNENFDRAVLGDEDGETELERDAVIRALLEVGAVGAGDAKGTDEVLIALQDPLAAGSPAFAPLLILLKNKRLPYLLRQHHRAVARDGWQLRSVRGSRWGKRFWYVERVWTSSEPPPGKKSLHGEGAAVTGAKSTTNVVQFPLPTRQQQQ